MRSGLIYVNSVHARRLLQDALPASAEAWREAQEKDPRHCAIMPPPLENKGFEVPYYLVLYMQSVLII